MPAHEIAKNGGWNIADCIERSYDLEGMHVGTVAAGRIGLAVLRRLKPFDVRLHYNARHRLPEAIERELGAIYHPKVEDMIKVCDIVTIHAPLHQETENMFNEALLSKMKRGAYIVDCVRAQIYDRDAVVSAQSRPACRLRWRRVASAAGSNGSSLAHDASQRDDATYLGSVSFRSSALRCRNARDT